MRIRYLLLVVAKVCGQTRPLLRELFRFSEAISKIRWESSFHVSRQNRCYHSNHHHLNFQHKIIKSNQS
jgi:hypothetical protein